MVKWHVSLCEGMPGRDGETGVSTAEPDGAVPNVLLVLADDLGWADVGYHDERMQTPRIDRFVEESVELDRFYAAPICTPTRCGMLTGRSPVRYGRMRSVLPPWRDMGLPTDERTLADVLATAGYERRGCFGKWHLGHSDPDYHPLNRGFTRFQGLYNGAFDYFSHTRDGELDWHREHTPSYENGYATDLLTDHAVEFIRDSTDDSPFFCYVPYTAPHAPNQTPPGELERYRDSELEGDRRVHAAMVSRLDNGVGRLLDALADTGLVDDTAVFVLSDNGGAPQYGGSNDPLRNGKQTAFEGGIRVPGAVRWPGELGAGRTVTAPVSYTDIFTTILRIAGVDDYVPPDGRPLDGQDMLDVFRGDSPPPDRTISLYWGQNGETERLGTVGDRWKLVYHDGPAVLEADIDDEALYLFDLDDDPCETTDVIDEHPHVASELLEEMQEFRRHRPDEGGVPAYSVGSDGFEAPSEWRMAEWSHD